jgi:hypothetical protein
MLFEALRDLRTNRSELVRQRFASEHRNQCTYLAAYGLQWTGCGGHETAAGAALNSLAAQTGLGSGGGGIRTLDPPNDG